MKIDTDDFTVTVVRYSRLRYWARRFLSHWPRLYVKVFGTWYGGEEAFVFSFETVPSADPDETARLNDTCKRLMETPGVTRFGWRDGPKPCGGNAQ